MELAAIPAFIAGVTLSSAAWCGHDDFAIKNINIVLCMGAISLTFAVLTGNV